MQDFCNAQSAEPCLTPSVHMAGNAQRKHTVKTYLLRGCKDERLEASWFSLSSELLPE